jgi:hypothetical protein
LYSKNVTPVIPVRGLPLSSSKVPENFTSRGTCDSETVAADTDAVSAAAVGSCAHAFVAKPHRQREMKQIFTLGFFTVSSLWWVKPSFSKEMDARLRRFSLTDP